MSTNEKDAKSPATTSGAYDAMLSRWSKMNALLGGTEMMRAAEQTYLPQHEEEGNVAYRERLSRATLFNQTALTLNAMVGRPFSDPVRTPDVTDPIAGWLEDIDLRGNAIGVFAREWFKTGLAKAFCHVMVDMPRATVLDRPRTLQDDRDEARRPYWVKIDPENVLAARSAVIDGKETLIHVRILEELVVSNGFAERAVQRIRVLEPGTVVLYEWQKVKGRKEQWVIIEEFETGLPEVPLITFYADREGLMFGTPPLTDLADINIAHWQSGSDQTAVLTVARFPILAASGVPKDADLTIGPHIALTATDPGSKFYYVEHEGKAIEAGRLDMQDMQERMAEFGAQFLKKRPGNTTATARALDSAEASSPLQDVSIRFQDALNQALALTARWAKIDLGNARLEISTDFGPEEASTEDLNALDKARTRHDISRKTHLTELQRRGILADEFDVDDDADELANEVTNDGATDVDLDPQGGEPEPEPLDG